MRRCVNILLVLIFNNCFDGMIYKIFLIKKCILIVGCLSMLDLISKE